MRVLSLEFENFMSYGERSRIDFQNNKDLYLVSGKNGNGKSVIANVLKFSIYGKVDGFNLSDLPNRMNKKLSTSVEFINFKGNKIKIERGLSPSFLRIYVNDRPSDLQDLSSKKQIETLLEQDIIGISFKVFCNLLVLSINDFKSFLKMTNRDKKEIVDKIFSLDEINDMQLLVKEKRKKLSKKILTLETEVSSLERYIESTNQQIKSILEKSEKSDLKELNELKKNRDETQNLYEKCFKDIQSVKLKRKEIKEELSEVKQNIYIEKSNYESIKKSLSLYENDKCPKCGSDLKDEKHTNEKNSLEKGLDSSKKLILTYKEKYLEKEEKNKEVEKKYSDLCEKQFKLQANLNYFSGKVSDIEKNQESKKTKELDNILEKFKVEKEEKQKLLKRARSAYDYYEILEVEVLSENGVKNKILQSVIPVLNENIKKYSKELHFPFEISFNDKFNCIITQLGEEINPSTLSFGERKIADLIIILSIIHAMKIKFPMLNLIFLDEIFSSIDPGNLLRILDLFKKNTKSMDINMLVISHNELPLSSFDKIIKVEKNNGFSELMVESVK